MRRSNQHKHLRHGHGCRRHGLAVTLIEDCCGYRTAIRHASAVRKLIQLTACATTSAEDLIAELSPPPPKKSGGKSAAGAAKAGAAKVGGGDDNDDKNLPLRHKGPDAAPRPASHRRKKSQRCQQHRRRRRRSPPRARH